MPRIRAEWELAVPFAQAHYYVRIAGTELALLLESGGEGPSRKPSGLNLLPRGSWAIVGAANPWSTELDPVENAARTRSLACELRRLGLKAAPARNAAADGSWAEDSFFVEGVTRHAVLAPARQFGQAAAIFAASGQIGLLWTRSERWVVMPRPRVLSRANGQRDSCTLPG